MNVFGETKILPLGSPDCMNQFQIYGRISRNYDHTFLFESLSGPEMLAETSVMGFDPSSLFRAYADRVEITRRHTRGSGAGDALHDTTTISTKDPLGALKSILKDAASEPDAQGSGEDAPVRGAHNEEYRYVGGAVGMVNYDAVRTMEKIPDSNGADPMIMEFGIYRDGIMYDHKIKSPFYFYRGRSRLGDVQAILQENAASDEAGARPYGGAGPFHAGSTAANIDKEEFVRMVTKAKEHILKGDIFQVVLSRRFEFEATGDTLRLYGALRRLNPSPYMYHIRHGSNVAIGASPEMLVRVTGDAVETFPIAGTRKVTGIKAEDRRLAEEMLADEKEVAEHTMLVDLGRNDIGRVCRFGTVRPESLMDIKRFSHVQHMVTHLRGGLQEGMDMFDAFRSVFPAGTVSGAPKVRAMEIIDDLEPAARGPYAGAAGYFSFNGCCDFAIAIRSVFVSGGRGFVQSGAGIVYDSVPEREFEETRHKADAMLQALEEASGR